MITRSQVEQALAPFEQVEELTLPHSDKLSVALTGDQFSFRSNGNAWPMQSDAVMQTIGWVPGMTSMAMREWPVEMALEVVNWWLQNGGYQVRLLVKDGEITSLPGPGSYLQPSKMLESLLSGFPGDEIGFESIIVSNGLVDVTTVSGEIQTVVGEDDRVYGGTNLRFRPDGVGDVQFFPYLWRQTCSNGMGVRHGFAHKRLMKVESSDDVYDFMADASPGVWTSVGEALESLEALKHIDVTAENLGAVVTDLMNRGNVPKRLRDRILEAIHIEDDGTMYGVTQGFARAGLADGLSSAQVYRLRMTAGLPLSVREHCDACSRPVGTSRREAVSVS